MDANFELIVAAKNDLINSCPHCECTDTRYLTDTNTNTSTSYTFSTGQMLIVWRHRFQYFAQ